MRIGWMAAAVLCLMLVAGEAAAAICIDVDLRFAGRTPSRISVQSMQDEASAIWEGEDVYLRWPPSRDASPCHGVHGSLDVLIEDRAASGRTGSRIVLGSTHLVPERIDHVPIRVDYDETEQLLETLLVSQRVMLLGHPEIWPVDLGRALGRIVAHEIGHILLADPRHQGRGLMRGWFTAADLVARPQSDMTLSRTEIERLRRREHMLEALEPRSSRCRSRRRPDAGLARQFRAGVFEQPDAPEQDVDQPEREPGEDEARPERATRRLRGRGLANGAGGGAKPAAGGFGDRAQPRVIRLAEPVFGGVVGEHVTRGLDGVGALY
jgi:hypothetical protein